MAEKDFDYTICDHCHKDMESRRPYDYNFCEDCENAIDEAIQGDAK